MIKHHFFKTCAALLLSASLLCFSGMTYFAAETDTAPTALVMETEDAPAALQQNADSDYEIVAVDKDDDDPNDHDSSEKEGKNWFKIIAIAAGISILITGIAVYMTYRGYKYNGQTEPYEFKKKAPLELSEREDVLVDVRVTSVHINRNNDNN